MKLVFVAYNEALEGQVAELLETISIQNYTKWIKVLGKGKKSGPHLSTPVWPKANNVAMMAIEDDQSRKLIQGVKTLRHSSGHEGIKAFVLPLEDLT